MEKNWVIGERGNSDPLSQLLINRGLKSSEAQSSFLNPARIDFPKEDYEKHFGISELEINRSTELVLRAIENNRPVIIYGDYDVDGLSSTAILWETIYFDLGYKRVVPFIPNRFEDGYGLSSEVLEKLVLELRQKGWDSPPLLITVDCGITAARQVDSAKKLGMSVIIIDHHSKPSVLPDADSIFWSDKLCGGGLAWFFVRALSVPAEDKLDLAALATIADLQPLTGVNRSIVKFGLREINSGKRVGLRALTESALGFGKEVGSFEVSWLLSPRLNAAGRLESALESLRILCTRNYNDAKILAQKLSLINNERQEKTKAMNDLAREEYLSQAESKDTKHIIISANPDYHEGIIGLVAGRLTQEFYRPSIIISVGEATSKGSARSIPGFDITEFLRNIPDVFKDLGGHSQAAGFSIETAKITEFQRYVRERAAVATFPSLIPSLEIDFELLPEELDVSFFDKVSKLSPFGLGNLEPIFCLTNLEITGAFLVGQLKNHLKLLFSKPGDKGKLYSYTGLWFEEGDRFPQFTEGSRVDVAFSIAVNTWKERTEVTLKIKDIRFSS